MTKNINYFRQSFFWRKESLFAVQKEKKDSSVNVIGSSVNMICSPVVHTSMDVATMIEDVLRCHRDMLSTVHGLNAENKHLAERVRMLEQSSEEKRIAEEQNKLMFVNKVTSQ